MTDSFADLLQSVLSDTLKSGAEAADVRLSRNASLAVEVRKGGLESVEREESCGIALRALIGRRQASVSGSDLSSGGLRLLSERVVAMAKQAPEDRYCGLAAPAEIETHPVDLDLDCDDTPEAGELERRAAEMEAVAMAVPGVRQVEHCGASWSTSETWLAASNGFAAQKTSGISSMAVMAIAERDGSMERDYESSSERRRALLKSPEWVGRQAAIRATARLGARKVDSQTVPVIFENRLASRLIGAVIGAISGPAIARGVSFL
jgi:PmbA protein